MSSLNPLIRLARFRLDEVRRVLTELRAEADRLYAGLTALDEELVREVGVARDMPESRLMIGAYLQRHKARRHAQRAAIADVEARIAIVTEELAEMFQELKRYELVDDARRTAEEAEAARLETRFYDEVGSVTHQRRQRDL